MSLSRRRFSKEFKLQVIREVEAGKSLAQAAREHEIHVNLIAKWRELLSKYGGEAKGGGEKK